MNILLLTFFFFLLLVAPPTNGSDSIKLDETGLPGSTDPSIKCGGCSPCGGATCYLSPPPPPPVYPPPPPKKPHSPSKPGCPPPPYEPGFIYVGAPPGQLYPIDQTYSGSTQIVIPAASVVLGILGLFLIV